MKISYKQLQPQLKNKLMPVYLISGDELLLVDEAAKLIREKAFSNGFLSKEKWYSDDSSFSWKLFFNSVNTRSLFSEKRFIELNIQQFKINAKDEKEISAVFEKSIDNKNIILIKTNKLDTKAQSSSLYKITEKFGTCVSVFQLSNNDLSIWIKSRFKSIGMTCDDDVIKIISEGTENNLLATSNEIEKLSLLCEHTHVTAEDLTNYIQDQSSFDVFKFIDCVLSGNRIQTLKILKNLQETGGEPLIVLWAIIKETRLLLAICYDIKNGKSLEISLEKNNVWEKRKSIIRSAANNHNYNSLKKLLSKFSQTDKIIKGVLPGNAWDHLRSLSMMLCR